MAYADYTFYTDQYYGNTIGPDDFDRLAGRAARYIDAATFNRAKNAVGEAAEAVKMANCALAEVWQDEVRLMSRSYSSAPPVTSESVGSWSRSFGGGAASQSDVDALNARKADILRLYLGQYGLLRMRT